MAHPPAGNRAGGQHDHDTKADAMTTYRIVRIRDPRTPVLFWFEIVATSADGTTETVAVCDTRDEARDTIKAMRKYTAAKAGAK